MANKVFLTSEDYIEIVVAGNQTLASIQQMSDEAMALAKSLREKGRKVLLIDNLLHIGNVPAEGRRLVVELMKSQQYDKLAMVGAGGAIKIGANLMLHATGKGSRVRYFDDYEQAKAWLTLKT